MTSSLKIGLINYFLTLSSIPKVDFTVDVDAPSLRSKIRVHIDRTAFEFDNASFSIYEVRCFGHAKTGNLLGEDLSVSWLHTACPLKVFVLIYYVGQCSKKQNLPSCPQSLNKEHGILWLENNEADKDLVNCVLALGACSEYASRYVCIISRIHIYVFACLIFGLWFLQSNLANLSQALLWWIY